MHCSILVVKNYNPRLLGAIPSQCYFTIGLKLVASGFIALFKVYIASSVWFAFYKTLCAESTSSFPILPLNAFLFLLRQAQTVKGRKLANLFSSDGRQSIIWKKMNRKVLYAAILFFKVVLCQVVVLLHGIFFFPDICIYIYIIFGKLIGCLFQTQ